MPFERKKRVQAKSADYTITAADHNSIIVTAGGADLEFTLPAAAGCKDVIVDFFNAIDYEMLITAPDEGLVAFNDATADGISFTTASEHIGASCRVFCDGSLWYVQEFMHGIGATVQTATIISA